MTYSLQCCCDFTVCDIMHPAPSFKVDGMLAALKDFLMQGVTPRPSLVTVARSSNDEYTPKPQVSPYSSYDAVLCELL